MSWDSASAAFAKVKNKNAKYWTNYLGFYSSWFDGYFNEPWAMLLPLDDHGFHRGDGVFEAVRVHSRAFIDLTPHLKRLERSAKAIGMEIPKTLDEIAEICIELGRRTEAQTGVLRLFVTRGPGGFSPAPNEVIGNQIYAVITKLKQPDDRLYNDGCKAMISSVKAKDPFWSQIKSCNYLQNVMMKMECQQKGFDFSISVGQDGFLCEGATENLLVITKDSKVLVPRFDYTLRGTTVSEVMKIAEQMPEINGVALADLRVEDLMSAKEAAFVGTTLGVLPIGVIESQVMPKSRIIVERLHAELMRRMEGDQGLRTSF